MNLLLIFLLQSSNFFFYAVLATELQNDSLGLKQDKILKKKSQVQIFLPPIIERGKNVWGSVFLDETSPFPHCKIGLNEKIIESDEFGLVKFSVPNLDKIDLKVYDDNGIIAQQIVYGKCGNDLLISDQKALCIVEKFSELTNNSLLTSIDYAPLVVEKGQVFFLFGKNFSGKFEDDEVYLDNHQLELFAGSSRSLLVLPSKQIPIGAIKQLVVHTQGNTSVPCEIDVCEVNVNENDSMEKANVKVMGSNMPVLLEIVNQNVSDSLHNLSASKSEEMRLSEEVLGSRSIVLSSGGLINQIELDHISKGSASKINAHIISNELFNPYNLASNYCLFSKELQSSLNKLEYMRLFKRFQALNVTLLDLNEKITKVSDLNTQNDLISKLRSVSLRFKILQRMLNSQKIILFAGGISLEAICDLEDKASDHTLISLESVLNKSDFKLDSAYLLATNRRKAKSSSLSVNRIDKQNNVDTMSNIVNMENLIANGSLCKTFNFHAPVSAKLVPPPAPYIPDSLELPYSIIKNKKTAKISKKNKSRSFSIIGSSKKLSNKKIRKVRANNK